VDKRVPACAGTADEMMHPASVRLPWWHPAALAATGLGVGYLPWVPGSWGSLLALVCGWEIVEAGGPMALAVAAVIAFAAGWWASARVAKARGMHDPRFVVIDEIAAQWLVLLVAPLHAAWYTAAFLLFRLFDIVKPWPIRLVERRVAGGLGIMLDDVLAAIYALVLLLIAEGILGVRP